jgi:hypothetical protein
MIKASVGIRVTSPWNDRHLSRSVVEKGGRLFVAKERQRWSGSTTHTEYATEVQKSLEQLHNRFKDGMYRAATDLWILGIDEFFNPI